MYQSSTSPYQDILQYPDKYIKIETDKIFIPVTYKKTWDDGFGARGWKVDVTIGDPQIIASTRETGQKINTSVFVHDILDHFLSGYGVSGHRSEAMALIQLSKRTKSNPKSDYEQIVKEDILNGIVNGESMKSFLPYSLIDLLPAETNMSDKEIMSFLIDKIGEGSLIDILIDNFLTLGKAGEKHALNSWKKLGLDPVKQTEIGVALQNLLIKIDSKVEEMNVDKLKGIITINNNRVSFSFHDGGAHNSSVMTTRNNNVCIHNI